MDGNLRLGAGIWYCRHGCFRITWGIQPGVALIGVEAAGQGRGKYPFILHSHILPDTTVPSTILGRQLCQAGTQGGLPGELAVLGVGRDYLVAALSI